MILSILICEDSHSQRQNIEQIISDHIAFKDYDSKIVLSTDNPDTLLAYVRKMPEQNNFYVLDVNLRHEMNGISLGQEIRAFDPFGKIIFVTTHVELALLTFQYRVEAMDYIVKDSMQNIKQRVCACVDTAYKQVINSKQFFQLKSIDGIQNISLNSILFFVSGNVPHKIILHTKNERIEFRGSLKEIEQMQPFFFRSHKSFVVNSKNIKSINRNVGEIIMSNNEIALITSKKLPALLDLLK